MTPVGPGRNIVRPLLRLLAVVAYAGGAEALEPAVLVRDINPGSSSGPTQLTRVDDRVFLTAVGEDGAAGRELWMTDGTAAGTTLVRDVNLEPYSESLIRDLTWFDGALFFGVGSPYRFGPKGLWTSDGTTAGTGPVTETESAANLLVAPQRLFFLAVGSLQSATICWRDLDQRVDCASFAVRLLGVPPAVAGERYFIAGAPAYDSDDFELWTSDGSAAGSHLLRDIRPGEQSSNPRELTALGARLCFVADDGSGTRLWVSDGSASGTAPLTAAPLAPGNLRAVAGRLFFVAAAPAGAYDLWVSDGTDAGTTVVRRFARQRDHGTSVFVAGAVGEAALLVANEGRDVWISDGTAAGTRRLRGFASQPPGVAPYGFTSVGTRTVFTACAAQGCEPWITDGTAAGTRQLADVWPGAPSSYADEYTRLGRHLLFRASTELGQELWKVALPGAPACAGDCDGSGATTIAELTLGVSIVLGSRPLAACAVFDADGDGAPSIADLVGAVAAGLAGCPAA